MAYNTSKGPRDMGDIKNEDDTDTQIDFGSDSITFKTNDISRLLVNNTNVSSSVNLSASALYTNFEVSASVFYGNGANLTGLSAGSVTSYTNAANNRVLTSVNANTINGEENFTFDGTNLVLDGNISGSGTFQTVGNAFFGGALNVTGNADFNGTVACDTSLTIDSTTINAAEIGVLDSVTAGTAAASKAMVLDASKDISGYRNLSGSGTLQAAGNVFVGGTLNVTGNADFNGTITCDDSITIDSVTITDTELGYLDGITLGTVAASKVVTVDASKDFSGYRNISGSGTFQAVGAATLGSTLNVSGNVEVAGTMHLSGNNSEALRISKEDGDAREIVFENGGADKAAIYLNSAENLFIRQEAASKDINLRVSSTNAVVVDGSATEVAFAWPISATSVSGSGTLQAVGATTLGSTLNVSGAVTMAGPASGSAAGPGSFLSVTSAGLLVLDEPAGGGGISFDGSTADGILTFKNSNEATVESGLTYNGSLLKVNGVISGSNSIHVNGDATFGSDLATTGSLTCSGSIRGKQIQLTHHAYNNTGTGQRWVPFYNLSDLNFTSHDFTGQMVAPFSGRLLRVIFRPSSNDAGTTIFTLYKAPNGVADIGTSELASGQLFVEAVTGSCTAAIATSNTFNFTGSTHFSAGEVVALAVDPTAGADNVNLTCVWEYDMFNV